MRELEHLGAIYTMQWPCFYEGQHMSNQSKIYLLNSLIEAMREWNEANCETDHWLEVGFIGADLSFLMATAALTVFEASASGAKATVDTHNRNSHAR